MPALRWETLIIIIIIIIIYPLTARVVGAPQMISRPVFSIFPCSPLPSGTWRTPGLSIPWCCLPTSSSACLVFFPPFTVPCKMAFARPDGDMTIPLQFASLYGGQEVFVWSSCLLDLGTDFLVGNMVFVTTCHMMLSRHWSLLLSCPESITAIPYSLAVLSSSFTNSKKFRTTLQGSSVELQSLITYLPSFTLFTGFLLNKELNTNCFSLPLNL